MNGISDSTDSIIIGLEPIVEGVVAGIERIQVSSGTSDLDDPCEKWDQQLLLLLTLHQQL